MGPEMRPDLFNELIESVKQAGAILRGEMEPGREFEFGAQNRGCGDEVREIGRSELDRNGDLEIP